MDGDSNISWDKEQDRLERALNMWVDYKQRLSEAGYGRNISGLASWHVLGFGLCCRVVKGSVSIRHLTEVGQSFDGWVLVRSLWETTLDVAYFAVQATHAARDTLADRYAMFDTIQRLQLLRKRGLGTDSRIPPEWLQIEAEWTTKYGGGTSDSWRGFSTTKLFKEIANTIAIETPDRIGPIVALAKVAAEWAEIHWGSSSKFTHGEPMALSRLWDATGIGPKWTDGPDNVDPAFCVREATHAMMLTVLLYAATSPAPISAPPMPIDEAGL